MRRLPDLGWHELDGVTRALLLLTMAFWMTVAAWRYWTFNFHDWDLAIFAQMLWNVGHGSAQSSILGVHVLGNHANLLLYPLAPLYRLLPHPLLLLALKIFCCTFAAVPLYLLARQYCGTLVARCLTLAYLINPGMTHVLAGEFDFEMLSPLFLFWLWWAFANHRRALFAGVALGSVLLKENIPLLVVMFGIAGALRGRFRWWWAGVAVAAAGYFLLMMWVVVPGFRGAESSAYWALYAHLGETPGEILTHLVLHPGQTVRLLVTPENVRWVGQLLLPLGLLAVLGLDVILVALPILLQNMLSHNPGAQTIFYQYVATVTPFVFVGTIYGIKRLLAWWPAIRWLPGFIGIGLLACSIPAQVAWGPWQAGPSPLGRAWQMRHDPLDAVRAELVKRIPRDAGVVATFQFLPALSRRAHLYAFHDAYLNRRRAGDETPYQLPDAATFALLDLNDPMMVQRVRQIPRLEQNIAAFYHRNGWRVEQAVDSLLLLRRGGTETESLTLYETSDAPGTDPPTAFWQFDGGIRLFYPQETILGEGAPGEVVPISFMWQSTQQVERPHALVINWQDAEGHLLGKIWHPIGHRVYPIWMWTPGQLVREYLYVLVPDHLMPGRYQLIGHVVDEVSQAPLAVTVADRRGSGVQLGDMIVTVREPKGMDE